MSNFEGKIILAKISDGAAGPAGPAGEGYYIKTNQEEVVYYKAEGKNEDVFSPDELYISVYSKMPPTEENKMALNTTNCDFGWLNEKTEEFTSLLTQAQEGVSSYSFDGGVLKYVLKNDDILNNMGSLLRFSYYIGEDKNLMATKLFPFRRGTGADLAAFSVSAHSINQYVAGKKITFDSDGLKLYGSAMELYNSYTAENPVLYVDTNGNLHLNGHLDAATGEFRGTISAESGLIGGFEISEGKLGSRSFIQTEWMENEELYVNNEGKYDKTESKIEGQTYYKRAISLDGNEGKIYANNIVLGSSATIEDSINLGGAYIYNPSSHDGVFLESGDISFYNNGTAKFGDIIINKTSDSDKLGLYGTNWSILPDRASFKNVSVSGEIETAIFKQGSVQTGGNTMLFMPSYKILEHGLINQEKSYLKIDQEVEDLEGKNVWVVVNNTYQLHSIESINNDEIILTKKLTLGQDEQPTVLIVIGSEDDLIIGINGSNTDSANENIKARGLTLTKLNQESPNLFLGDLEKVGKTGYGLYSDNVHLNGSLITNSEDVYAGVNTTDGWETDKGKVVFWAGVEKNDNGEYNYKNAPFYVTQKGYVYAQNIELVDVLQVGGKIQGAKIFTAEIHGADKNGEAAGLSIYDTQNGISFKTTMQKDKEIETVETFSIGVNGLKAGKENFISIDENKKVVFIGNEFKVGGENQLSLGWSETQKCPALWHASISNSCGFYFKDASTVFQMNASDRLSIGSSQINLYGELTLSETGYGKLVYKKAEEGYDLFVE